MSPLLIKLAVAVIGAIIFAALKRANAAEESVPPPLPAPSKPYRPRRRAAAPASAPAETVVPAQPSAPPAVREAVPAVAPRRRARFRFEGAADLRRAFVASEVLGRPVSLRAPRL
ncbi:MAG: hypothetical protein ACKORB_08455 [Opitutia bacterium]